MLFCDLVRITVLLAAGAATVLSGVTVVSADQANDTTTLIVSAGWWPAAAALGLYQGRGAAAADAVRTVLAGARTTPNLPPESPAQVAIARLWPIGAFTIVAGVVGFVLPGVSAIGTGYALYIALAWRRREPAVAAIEDRDGVRFFVEPGSALQPLRLIRTPGLRRDRPPAAHPPPASPAT